MQCTNHPEITASARCEGCAEGFCQSCLVTVAGKRYCAKCKTMAVTDAPVVEANTMPCPEAGEALKYAIIGLFCFGIVLGPIAISKALNAKRLIAANPSLTGGGKATAALVIGISELVLWVLGTIARVSGRS